MSTEDLDDILFRFHQAADVVTPALVERWTQDYPQYADEIRERAVDIIDMQFFMSLDPLPVNEEVEAPVVLPATADVLPTLREAAEGAGTKLRDLADDLDIARSVLADLNAGRIVQATIPDRLCRLVAERLGRAHDWLARVVQGSHELSPAPAFKASESPQAGRQRTWVEAVNDSDMEPERKAFWLSEGR